MGRAEYHPLDFQHRSEAEMLEAAEAFRASMTRRRTVRDYSSRPVQRAIIEHALLTAGTAPSGANQQPWSFAAIASPDIKRRIRAAAEEEEKAFYAGRAGEEWLGALAHLGTDWEKPFLTEAPWLIAIFAQRWGEESQPDGSMRKVKHYYVPESVGIATGFLIAALHQAGLATLTHTPSPMGFLNEICGRPDNEKAVILLVVGYPKEGCLVPRISKKRLEETTTWL
jgi:iodotyrosine deiodinase